MARWTWLAIYVLSNLVALGISLNTGVLIGDADGIAVSSASTLASATIIVCLSYIIILGPLFSFLERMSASKEIKTNPHRERTGEKIGIALISAQLLFFAFNVFYGVNTAGSANTRTDTPLSIVWVLIPVDYIFVVYYGLYRENRYFYPNLLIWSASNLARGWSSFLLIIIFLEHCRLHRERKITTTLMLTATAATVAIYPIVTAAKWAFRATSGTGIDMFSVISQIGLETATDGYGILIQQGLFHLVGRLQNSSMLTVVIELTNKLQYEFISNSFTPFWREGLPGIIYEIIIDGRRSTPIGTAITGYASLGNPESFGDWNSNISYAGWFFIAPQHAFTYLIYTLTLCTASFFLIRKCGGRHLAIDGLWLAWLLYLMPPWWGAFMSYLQALLVMLILQRVLRKRIKRRGNVVLNRSQHSA